MDPDEFLRILIIADQEQETFRILFFTKEDDSCCGDIVLDSFNKAYRDEENILGQIYKSNCVRIILMMILFLYNIIRKCLLTVALKPNFMSPLLLCDVFL